MKTKLKILTTYWFITALLLLLVNDFILKEIYGNWLTGKLSDFAGLFVFSVFWVAFFPKFKTKIFLATAFIFVLFKSPFSQPFINTWNSLELFSISRIVDFTDLIALSVLPLAYYFMSNKNLQKTVKIPIIVPLIISSFAFLATSYEKSVDINKEYIFNISKDSLKTELLKVNKENYILPILSDTVEMRISHNICNDKVAVLLIFNEIQINKTKIIFKKAFYNCSKKGDYENETINAFENQIINKLNKSE